MSIPYIILALLVFGLLIFIHELGHFLAARACGVGILEFSIGMGPKILSKRSKKSGTLYSLRLFPLGGYVSMLGENGMEVVQGDNGEKKEDDLLINSTDEIETEAPAETPVDPELAKRAYCNQSVWKRILISIAGPFMNVFLGFLLMFCIVWASGVNSVGTTTVGGFYVQYSAETAQENGFLPNDYINYVKDSAEGSEAVRIHSLNQLREVIEASETGVFEIGVLRTNEEGMVVDAVLQNVSLNEEFLDTALRQSLSAEKLQIGDTVIKVNSTSVHTYYELAYEIMNQGYKPITFTVERGGQEIELEPVQVPTAVDPASNTVFGDLDFKVYGEDEFGFGTILKHAWYRSTSTVKMVYDSLVGLFSGRFGVEAVSGPVGITKTISDVAKTGILNVLYLVTVISINLGIMNLLPFPALDGGHLLLYLIEIIRRKPVKKEVEGMINFIGLVILLALAVLVAIKDIIAL
ncbi:MAG: RIP metalloprotease RseP [Clostridia bacterium]|nr:RIP metalloprotease RseP [Clostridia bacterium]